MAVTQLTLYNKALLLMGERSLASLSEEREPRRRLDEVWDSGAAVKYCLEQGQWNFAMRTVQVDYDTNIEPDFGYQRAFEKPSDWVITSALCADENFRVPLLEYWDEAGYWYANLDTIYVRYVSNHVTYGLDYTLWPESFREYVEEYLCSKVVLAISEDDDKEAASLKRLRKKLLTAKSRAAMSDPTSFPAQGGWSSARQGRGFRGDRGNNGSLIG
jgi:hypothetical protein